MVNINFNIIILYGPFLHQHENGWMFLGFYKAFLYKRYKVIWVNEEKRELLNNYDLSYSLFLTDGIHDEHIPLREDSFYVLFQNNKSKYDGYNKLYLDVYHNDLTGVQQWKDKFYIQYSIPNRQLYFPLATELLPNEILANQQSIAFQNKNIERHFCFIGNVKGDGVSSLLSELKSLCIKNYYKTHMLNNSDILERQEHIMTCKCIVTILSNSQIARNEIDHHVFQVIAYGGCPITNSSTTASLFQNNMVYHNRKSTNLFFGGIENKVVNTPVNRWKLMEVVKNNHTYVKRLETIFWMLLRL